MAMFNVHHGVGWHKTDTKMIMHEQKYLSQNT